ncbi:unnamed protein product [Prunus brigantina]
MGRSMWARMTFIHLQTELELNSPPWWDEASSKGLAWQNRTDAIGNGILNGKNESDIRTGLIGVCQLLYFPISCLFTSPNWCTFSPNSLIGKKEISKDHTRPMKSNQGFYALAKHTHYNASIT